MIRLLASTARNTLGHVFGTDDSPLPHLLHTASSDDSDFLVLFFALLVLSFPSVLYLLLLGSRCFGFEPTMALPRQTTNASTATKPSAFLAAAALLVLAAATAVQTASAAGTHPLDFDQCVPEGYLCEFDAECEQCLDNWGQSYDEDECREQYPVMDTAPVRSCDYVGAAYCCTFASATINACLSNQLTLDYMECVLYTLECSLDDMPCYSGGEGDSDDGVDSPDDTPAPVASLVYPTPRPISRTPSPTISTSEPDSLDLDTPEPITVIPRTPAPDTAAPRTLAPVTTAANTRAPTAAVVTTPAPTSPPSTAPLPDTAPPSAMAIDTPASNKTKPCTPSPITPDSTTDKPSPTTLVSVSPAPTSTPPASGTPNSGTPTSRTAAPNTLAPSAQRPAASRTPSPDSPTRPSPVPGSLTLAPRSSAPVVTSPRAPTTRPAVSPPAESAPSSSEDDAELPFRPLPFNTDAPVTPAVYNDDDDFHHDDDYNHHHDDDDHHHNGDDADNEDDDPDSSDGNEETVTAGNGAVGSARPFWGGIEGGACAVYSACVLVLLSATAVHGVVG